MARVHAKIVLRLHTIAEGRPARLPEHPVSRVVAILLLRANTAAGSASAAGAAATAATTAATGGGGIVAATATCAGLLEIVRLEVDEECVGWHPEAHPLRCELVVPAHAVLSIAYEAFLVLMRHAAAGEGGGALVRTRFVRRARARQDAFRQEGARSSGRVSSGGRALVRTRFVRRAACAPGDHRVRLTSKLILHLWGGVEGVVVSTCMPPCTARIQTHTAPRTARSLGGRCARGRTGGPRRTHATQSRR